jgi:hypothetical protein
MAPVPFRSFHEPGVVTQSHSVRVPAIVQGGRTTPFILRDIIGIATKKSRLMSSPKSTPSLRVVTLQNRVVKAANYALAHYAVNTSVDALEIERDQ